MIELRNVSLRYGSREILKDVSLTIEDKKIKAILGPSGVGKSTIIKLMLGLIKPTSGQVLVDEVDITHMSEVELFPIRQKMGIVFQGNALFDSMTITENMSFFLRENLNLPESEIAARVQEQMKFAGLEGFENNLPDSLSGGMRKRVAIGRALIFHPKMILFDEPTAGLDPLSSKKILDLIKRLQSEIGTWRSDCDAHLARCFCSGRFCCGAVSRQNYFQRRAAETLRLNTFIHNIISI
jgi:phospholipid/cholesterol/gamma-HCH transport system ATP-binding protein